METRNVAVYVFIEVLSQDGLISGYTLQFNSVFASCVSVFFF